MTKVFVGGGEEQIVEFVSRVPWHSHNAPNLFVSCSDGRFGDADHQLIHHLDLERPDELSIPGGPGRILLSGPMFFAERDKIKLLHGKHHFTRIVGVAHHDCAYYQGRYPHLAPEARKERQIADLREFRVEVGKLVPGAQIETFYAGPGENATIQYVQIK